MKDLTSTSFGLVIAYLLPGLVGYFAISLWWPGVLTLSPEPSPSELSLGGSLLIVLASIAIGLEISVARWVVFEKGFCRHLKRHPSALRHLGVEAKLVAFRAAVDEHYRYHQFWGGIAIVLPFVVWGLVRRNLQMWPSIVAGAALLEAVNVAGAYSAFSNYVDSGNKILQGLPHGERLESERQRIDEVSSAISPAAPTAPTAAAAPAEVAKAVTCDTECAVTPTPDMLFRGEDE